MQLICFGAGLLRDEKVESFMWLFNNFLITMRSHWPKTIIMDEDPVIRQVIVDVFDTSIHQFYMCHTMRKLHEKVGCTLNDYKDFIEQIKGCVWASDSLDEFEES